MSKKSFKEELKEWKNAIIWSLLVFLFIVKPFVVSGYKIPSGSMEDTLLIGDYLMVDKFTYGGEIPLVNIRVPGFRDPKPGDIVVFWSPEGPKPSFWDQLFFWKKSKNLRLVKRCVAEGGQTVEVRDKQLYVDGQRREEPYVKHIDARVFPGEYIPRDNFGPVTVPEGYYFMMGDNRDDSHDSRFFGPVSRQKVIGTPLLIYFSMEENRRDIRFERILTLF
ncbi:MAG TPA: signal peptidase I [Candidatus Mcinerneyibacteriales bacterium]|nr:signal peptidase I [Candidatus Mcinerneyibacteriales bacterium]